MKVSAVQLTTAAATTAAAIANNVPTPEAVLGVALGCVFMGMVQCAGSAKNVEEEVKQ